MISGHQRCWLFAMKTSQLLYPQAWPTKQFIKMQYQLSSFSFITINFLESVQIVLSVQPSAHVYHRNVLVHVLVMVLAKTSIYVHLIRLLTFKKRL